MSMKANLPVFRTRRLLVAGCLALAAATPHSAEAMVFTWNLDADSPWNNTAGWTPLGLPNGPDDTAILGGVITAGRTIMLMPDIALNQLIFDSSASYTLGGSPFANRLTLGGNVATAGIDVLQGDHQIQADVQLAVDAAIEVGPGAMITLGSGALAAGLTLNGNRFTKTGPGELRINSAIGLSGGTLDGRAGLVSGIGTLSGDFVSRQTVVSPGENDRGTLTILGDYTQLAGGTLEIEIGGPRELDQLAVGGTASLGGTLDLRLIAGTSPVPGAVYQILTANEFEAGQSFDFILGLATPGGGSFGFNFDLTDGLKLSFTISKGDMNGDLEIDGSDVERFAWAIRDPNTYFERFFLNGQQECNLVTQEGCTFVDDFMADMDGDGFNTFADIPLFVEIVNNAPGMGAISVSDVLNLILAVPEPSSGWFALALLLVFGGRRF